MYSSFIKTLKLIIHFGYNYTFWHQYLIKTEFILLNIYKNQKMFDFLFSEAFLKLKFRIC